MNIILRDNKKAKNFDYGVAAGEKGAKLFDSGKEICQKRSVSERQLDFAVGYEIRLREARNCEKEYLKSLL